MSGNSCDSRECRIIGHIILVTIVVALFLWWFCSTNGGSKTGFCKYIGPPTPPPTQIMEQPQTTSILTSIFLAIWAPIATLLGSLFALSCQVTFGLIIGALNGLLLGLLFVPLPRIPFTNVRNNTAAKDESDEGVVIDKPASGAPATTGKGSSMLPSWASVVA